MVIGAINNYNYSISNPNYSRKDVNSTDAIKNTASASIFAPQNTPSIAQTPSISKDLAFSGVFSSPEIKDPEQNKKYQEIKNISDPDTKKSLKNLLKTGRLLNKDSNDGSTTLDNLYTIATSPRHEGLDNRVILKDTVKEIENPFIINQKFGEIPEAADDAIVGYEKQLQSEGKAPAGLTLNPKDYNVEYSSTCPAASMQFNIADKRPAEYARIAAGLTSPESQIVKKVPYKNIAPSTVEALELLKDFNVTTKKNPNSWDDIDVIVKPDDNAMIRAQIQNTNQRPGERSAVSTLMQSAFMNLASQNAYNSLTDKRYGKFSTNNEGLTEFEKNFLESVMDEQPKVSIVYQNIDDNQKLQGYNFNFKDTEQHLLESLKSGSNVIIGIIEFDENKTVIGGHEITVIGAKKDMKGGVSFICQDSDDNYDGPIMIKSEDLVPKIHHAGIPAKLVELPQEKETGYQILDDYNNYKKSQQAA
jgi:hypothetical protein